MEFTKFLAAMGERFTSVVSRSYEHHAGNITIGLSSTLIFRENTLGMVRDSHIFSPSTNHQRVLSARRLFRVPPCLKGTIQLQTYMPSPVFEPWPNGKAVSVTNQNTEWVVRCLNLYRFNVYLPPLHVESSVALGLEFTMLRLRVRTHNHCGLVIRLLLPFEISSILRVEYK
ncbi:hypothetical protein TNCV_738131 [Trichonephila clavipes]|nr:hypothetical protein TNCV_738131 [Trichonephila clavipes]